MESSSAYILDQLWQKQVNQLNPNKGVYSRYQMDKEKPLNHKTARAFSIYLKDQVSCSPI